MERWQTKRQRKGEGAALGLFKISPSGQKFHCREKQRTVARRRVEKSVGGGRVLAPRLNCPSCLRTKRKSQPEKTSLIRRVTSTIRQPEDAPVLFCTCTPTCTCRGRWADSPALKPTMRDAFFLPSGNVSSWTPPGIPTDIVRANLNTADEGSVQSSSFQDNVQEGREGGAGSSEPQKENVFFVLFFTERKFRFYVKLTKRSEKREKGENMRG